MWVYPRQRTPMSKSTESTPMSDLRRWTMSGRGGCRRERGLTCRACAPRGIVRRDCAPRGPVRRDHGGPDGDAGTERGPDGDAGSERGRRAVHWRRARGGPRRRDRTPTSGSRTEPAAMMSESPDRTVDAKPREIAASAASLGPSTYCPKTLARTRPVERNIERADAKEEMWLRNPI